MDGVPDFIRNNAGKNRKLIEQCQISPGSKIEQFSKLIGQLALQFAKSEDGIELSPQFEDVEGCMLSEPKKILGQKKDWVIQSDDFNFHFLLVIGDGQSDEVKPRLEAEYGSIQESGFCYIASEEVQ